MSFMLESVYFFHPECFFDEAIVVAFEFLGCPLRQDDVGDLCTLPLWMTLSWFCAECNFAPSLHFVRAHMLANLEVEKHGPYAYAFN